MSLRCARAMHAAPPVVPAQAGTQCLCACAAVRHTPPQRRPTTTFARRSRAGGNPVSLRLRCRATHATPAQADAHVRPSFPRRREPSVSALCSRHARRPARRSRAGGNPVSLRLRCRATHATPAQADAHVLPSFPRRREPSVSALCSRHARRPARRSRAGGNPVSLRLRCRATHATPAQADAHVLPSFPRRREPSVSALCSRHARRPARRSRAGGNPVSLRLRCRATHATPTQADAHVRPSFPRKLEPNVSALCSRHARRPARRSRAGGNPVSLRCP